MKHIKTLEDFINESAAPLNESREDKDVARAIELGKIKRDDIVTLAKKTTVPEYAQDYIQAYDRIIDFNNKAKQSKSDIKWMSKDMKEFYMLLDKGVKHNDKTIKALATKIDKALDPYVRESQVDESNEVSTDDVRLFWTCQTGNMCTKLYLSIAWDGRISDDTEEELIKRIKSKLVHNMKQPKYADSGNTLGEFELGSLEELIKFRDGFTKFTKNKNS